MNVLDITLSVMWFEVNSAEAGRGGETKWAPLTVDHGGVTGRHAVTAA